MKAVILAGGYGTRISEESSIRPKPMVEIGDKPILWHVMKIYSHYGINDFIICLGYKGDVIKDYFASYGLHKSDVTFDLGKHKVETHSNGAEKWRVTLVDTGEETMTGGRIKRIQEYVGDETFCLTYGDGVSDVDIQKLIRFHKRQKVLATVNAVQPPGRFGVLNLKKGSNIVKSFREKPQGDGMWINGGFFVCEPGIFKYINGDSDIWEREPMRKLAQNQRMAAYKHAGFWQCMDTLRDKNVLEDLWKTGKAPWKVWK